MPCEEWTDFYCGDDKVVKWKIVQIEKDPRGRGIPKICRRVKKGTSGLIREAEEGYKIK
jgi:hypothetical protein